MKKFSLIIAIILTCTLVFVACDTNGTASNDNNGNGYENGENGSDYPNGENGEIDWDDLDGNPDPELLALIHELLEGVEDAPEPPLWESELRERNFEEVLFIDYIPGARGVISQPMVGAIPHAVVLLELPEDVDSVAVAAEIYDAADPTKWICVAAEKIGVFARGDFVVMVMSWETVVDGIEANLDEVLG